MMKKEKVNHLAVVVVVILQQGIGAVWYSPFMFGQLWLNFIGGNVHVLERLGYYPYCISLLSSFVFSYFLVWVIRLDNAQSSSRGARLGFIIWCGAIVPITIAQYIFATAPAGIIVTHLIYFLTVLVFSGAIIAHWDKQ